jgi:hypothetical protein
MAVNEVKFEVGETIRERRCVPACRPKSRANNEL